MGAVNAKKHLSIFFLIFSNFSIIQCQKRYAFFANVAQNEALSHNSFNSICAQKCLAKQNCKYAYQEKGGSCIFSSIGIPQGTNGNYVMRQGYYADCLDAKRHGLEINSVVPIMLQDFPRTVEAYCDMHTHGGGWLVVQRRLNGIIIFDKDWNDYVLGFGSPEEDFWIGLDNLHLLTTAQPMKLRIDITNSEGEIGFAEYEYFKVHSAMNYYRLSISGYSGNISDGLNKAANNMMFSTRDKDNDGSAVTHCAYLKTGGWWFNKCHQGNLNGQFGTSIGDDKQMSWYPWKSRFGDLKYADMKIKPRY